MGRLSILEEIRGLDPVRDHQRIVHLDSCYEFPFDTTRSLEFALFRTFAVPSIAAFLDQSGEFLRRPQKRYDDTDLIFSEFMEWGYDSDRGRAAIRRMNHIHSRFSISNDDFLYVLSANVFEPIRWNARFGWRPMCEQERLGTYYFWRQVGRRMNIKAVPEDYGSFERFNVDYEREHFRYSEANRRIGEATRDLFLSWYPLPKPLRPLGEQAVYALIDESLLEAFGFPKPSAAIRRTVEGALKLRARVLRLMPPRRRPRVRTEMRHRTYPNGYRIEELGPPEPIG